MRRVGFSRGARWLFDGADLVGRAPGPLAGVAALMLLVSMVQLVHPVYGPLLLLVIGPLLTAGVLTAFQGVVRGGRPLPTVLFAGWRDPQARWPLLMLGMWVLLGVLAVVLVMVWWIGADVTAEQLEALLQSSEAAIAFVAERNIWSLLVPVGMIAAVVLAALFFAVPQVRFAHQRPLNALWLSLNACARNWAALTAFGLMALGLGVAAGFVAGLVALVLSLAFGAAGQWLAQIPLLIIALVYQLILTGGQYRAYVEVFGAPGGDDQGGRPDRIGADDQFVA